MISTLKRAKCKKYQGEGGLISGILYATFLYCILWLLVVQFRYFLEYYSSALGQSWFTSDRGVSRTGEPRGSPRTGVYQGMPQCLTPSCFPCFSTLLDLEDCHIGEIGLQARKMRSSCVTKDVRSAAGAKNDLKTFSNWNFTFKSAFFGACGAQLILELYPIRGGPD